MGLGDKVYFEINDKIDSKDAIRWREELNAAGYQHPYQDTSYIDLWPVEQHNEFKYFMAWSSIDRDKLIGAALLRFRTYKFGIIQCTSYRGPLCKHFADLEIILLGLVTQLKKQSIDVLVVSPYFLNQEAYHAENVLTKLGFQPSQVQGGHVDTVCVKLCKDEKQLISTFNENTRRQIRKSEKLNLNAVAISSEAEIRELHQVYNEMALTRGADKLDLDYFNRFNEYVKSNPDRGLILALKENGKIIAGVMILNNHKMAWYIHGASDANFRERPLTFICHWEAMKYFSQRGLESYNFGGLGAQETLEAAN
jgi:Acetyltransferase (GNAT) domain